MTTAVTPAVAFPGPGIRLTEQKPVCNAPYRYSFPGASLLQYLTPCGVPAVSLRRIEILCHDINVHVPHHVASRIPSYNLRMANEALRSTGARYGRGTSNVPYITAQSSRV